MTELAISRRTHSCRDPIAALPTELGAEIFELCVLYSRLRSPFVKSGEPLSLSQVCRKWRELAHSTPSLWSTLALYRIQATKTTYLPVISRWLTRSKTLPLTIVLSNAGTYHEDVPTCDEFQGHYGDPETLLTERSIAVINVVAVHAERWSNLSLALVDRCLEASIWIEICGRLYQLRSLKISARSYFSQGGTMPEDATWSHIFSSANNLRILKLDQEAYPWLSSSLKNDIPWLQLTDISIQLWSRRDYISLLERCPAVVKLRVLVQSVELSDWDDVWPLAPCVELNSLFELRLEACDLSTFEIIASILDATSSSSLKILCLKADDELFDAQSEELHRFLMRSGAQIRDLTVELNYWNPGMEEDDSDIEPHFVMFLEQLPMLKRLTLPSGYFNEHLLQNMITMQLAPLLEDFIVLRGPSGAQPLSLDDDESESHHSQDLESELSQFRDLESELPLFEYEELGLIRFQRPLQDDKVDMLCFYLNFPDADLEQSRDDELELLRFQLHFEDKESELLHCQDDESELLHSEEDELELLPFEVDSLLQMVKSRTRHPELEATTLLGQPMSTVALKHLSLPFAESLRDEAISELRALSSSGLAVVME